MLQGLVTDTNGAALAGVEVKSGTASGTSQADGSYALSVSPGAGLKVSASKTGCVDTFRVLTLAAGQTVPLDFSLSTVWSSAPLQNLLTTDATITNPQGAEVKLTMNTLVDSNGAPVDAATVAVTAGQPTDSNFAAGFPGLFLGSKAGDNNIDIESFGYVTVDITSAGGDPCNLKPGATAELAIPVVPGSDPGTPTIDLWSLNETTGKWTFVAPATRDTSGAIPVYRAQVSHFSTYNLDRPIDSSLPFTITVEDSSHAVVSGATVVVSSTNTNGGGVWSGTAVTGANGTCFFPNVPQGTVAMNAAAGNQVGHAYHYDVNNGAGSVTITLFEGVQRTYTVVYLNNGVQVPLANVQLSVAMGDNLNAGGNGGPPALGITNANGQATLGLQSGHLVYTYFAYTTIGGTPYSINGNVSSLDAIPATWILTP